MYISHPLIKPDCVEQRIYQTNIAAQAIKKSTLVVLPTGLGKTIIALLVIAEKLTTTNEKILFLSPTKPLVNQHAQFLRETLLSEIPIAVFTGELAPEKRKALWDTSKIIVSTPQVIENDLITQQVNLKKVSLIIFDEAHRAVGNYSYVFVSNQYQQQREGRLVLGMTASPGNDLQKIVEVCKNLEIEHIEIRTKYDRDVRPYVYDVHIQWKEIALPQEFSQVLQLLKKSLSGYLTVLKNIGVTQSASVQLINRTKLLEIQQLIQQQLKSSLNPPKELFDAASAQNAALKLYHAIELLQTQGVNAFLTYFQRMQEEAQSKGGSKASRTIMKDLNVLEALAYAKSLTLEHPKIPEIKKIVIEQLTKHPQSQIIIFTHYRDTAYYVLKNLEGLPDVRPVRFIGQSGKEGDKGLSQKKQMEIIQQFKNRIYNVLIATSVAEEGLDIPSTDLVIFYEPVPSEIRTIQRRGRTARKMPGNVIILITKGTPDEGYYWSARRKERLMHSELETLRTSLKKKLEDPKTFYTQMIHPTDNQQRKLDESILQKSESNNDLKIFVDHRESRSEVIKRLVEKKIKIEPKQLDVGDYVLSSRLGVERKTVDDYLTSLLEGKLFLQLRKLREAYSRPLLILEGEELFTKRNINHNAIYGSFASIIIDFGIPILMTKTPQETADVLYIMACREQKDGKKPVVVRGDKWIMPVAEQQQYIVEGFPHISTVLAQRLLQQFGTIRAIANATEEELCEVPGIGKNIASEIVKILNTEYLKKQ
ncbi:MAG: DEAD/DEAH box helicase [Candidatus Thermoplasmatota archaeon]